MVDFIIGRGIVSGNGPGCCGRRIGFRRHFCLFKCDANSYCTSVRDQGSDVSKVGACGRIIDWCHIWSSGSVCDFELREIDRGPYGANTGRRRKSMGVPISIFCCHYG